MNRTHRPIHPVRDLRVAHLLTLILAVLPLVVAGTAAQTAGWMDILATSRANAIIARGDSLWIGTSGGLIVKNVSDLTSNLLTKSTSLLPSNTIRALALDSTGALLVVTDGMRPDRAIIRFDGAAWSAIAVPTGTGALPFRSIAVDSRGNLWCGSATTETIMKYDGTSWQTVDVADGSVAGVRKIVVAKGDRIWALTDALLELKGTTHDRYTEQNAPINGYINDIAPDTSGAIWLATSSTAQRFDGADWRTFSSDVGIPQTGVASVLVTRRGTVHFGSADGLMTMVPDDAWKIDSIYHLITAPVPRKLAHLAEGKGATIWGIARVETPKSTDLTLRFTAGEPVRLLPYLSSPLYSSYIGGMAIDRWGEMWAGGEGVASIGWSARLYDTVAGGVSLEEIYAVGADKAGDVWVGMANGRGLVRFGRETVTHFDRNTPGYPFSSETATITAITADSAGGVWIVTYVNGAARFDGTSWSTPIEPCYNCISAATRADGTVFFGGEFGGIGYMDGPTLKSPRFPDGADFIDAGLSLAAGSGRSMWVGGAQGLYRIIDSTITRFAPTADLPAKRITAVAESKGEVWAGIAATQISPAGLARYTGSEWKIYTTSSSPLANDYIRSIVPRQTQPEAGPIDEMWIGTADGINVLVPADFSTVPMPPERPESATGITIWPNPLDGRGMITWSMETGPAGGAEVRIIDLLGADVTHLASISIEAEEHRATIDADRLPEGTYLIEVRAEEGRQSSLMKRIGP